jgi:hypothetical protein
VFSTSQTAVALGMSGADISFFSFKTVFGVLSAFDDYNVWNKISLEEIAMLCNR